MGVLDPIERRAEGMSEIRNKYFDWLDITLDNLRDYGPAIINDRYDLLEEEDPFFFLIWRDDNDFRTIDSRKELNHHIEVASAAKQDLNIGHAKNKVLRKYAKRKDIDPDFDNPLDSFKQLDNLQDEVENFIPRVDEKISEAMNIDISEVEESHDYFSYKMTDALFKFTDKTGPLPAIEGVAESLENIEKQKEELLAKSVDEHRRHKEELDPSYDRTEIPKEPVDWSEVLGGMESLSDYVDVSDIPTATYGDTLHMRAEQVVEDVEGVSPEYGLHFRNPGGRYDTSQEGHLDFTDRPDAVEDLYVHEFKHTPAELTDRVMEGEILSENEKFIEHVEQVNKYLNELGLEIGILAQVSTDMEVQQYVIERHDRDKTEEAIEQNVYLRSNYNFDNVLNAGKTS